MAEWLEARLECLLDNLIFAGILAGAGAVWAALKALPIPVIVGIAIGVFIVILLGIRLSLKFSVKPQAIKKTLENEQIPKLAVKLSSGRREFDWQRTQHLMWAELRLTNTSTGQTLNDVEV